MSCITEILKMKGNQDVLYVPNNPGTVIEGGGKYHDYEYIITFTDIGHRCGYVAISPEHPCYGKNLDMYDHSFDVHVHGGITFHEKPHLSESLLLNPCQDEWIGFDAAHAMDLPDYDLSLKYFPKNSYADFLFNHPELKSSRYSFDGLHKTFSFMEEECKKLIEQLIAIKNSLM